MADRITSEELSRILNEELTYYRTYALNRLSESMRKAGVILSGETLKSLHAEVLQASQNNVARLLLYFNESGRIREMRNLTYRQLPPQSEIEAFVRKVGVSNFRYVPGYKFGHIPTEDIAVRRIAWGIRIAKRRENTTKPKKWYAKTFYSSLNVLVDNIITRYQQTTGQVIGGSIRDGF
ncbi:hypothetical protein [Xanthocytophaga flava]|uniref:hypothetical protein n=1 Tax=Xanthocytophaga flava TaxID=3048013 RepID=UPI0028D60CA9|nr:hypothetical protein [Xanthocytophaga flavus]MDJ1468152.1 hypothetical protein [Xanthocytophaga flavus]